MLRIGIITKYNRKTGMGILRDHNNQKIKFFDLSIHDDKGKSDSVFFEIVKGDYGLIAIDLY
ncbi:hypothetical protein EZ449_19050 [Pedobacter frigidisoli]|uniref:Cold shock protein, CspA family n=1 Tax=Pedobacter frigidisoli TaxID=2530455 RepID=A0A4R0NQ61_9SPHI|nr:hypothetical protein [Pedobacter frigidisoli]TCD02158.1 hypothetical protein EZ449_19050 [Pedobacter frigidisoli]